MKLRPDSFASRLRRVRLAVFALSALTLPASPCPADEIVVGGETAAGKVVSVGPKGLEVETNYGKGNVLVPFDRVTTLHTDQIFVLVHGDDGITRGRLVGVREGELLVEDEAGGVTAIPVATLFNSLPVDNYDSSALARWRSRLRYWNARYDLAFGATESTVDSIALATGFEIERRKTPTRFLAIGGYRYGFNRDHRDNSESTTDNELVGVLRGEYTFWTRYYAFAAGSAEYDEVERLAYRLTPKAGLGIHIFQTEAARWDVDAGIAVVRERFFSENIRTNPSAAFGTDASIQLPLGAVFTARGEYLPAFNRWASDYLLRGSAALDFPMTEWLSLRTTILNTYDNTPAEDTDRNSFTATTGLALVF